MRSLKILRLLRQLLRVNPALPSGVHFASFNDVAVIYNSILTQDGKAMLARAYFGLMEI
jgi:hypothetical protein